jgi:hypothetical protein
MMNGAMERAGIEQRMEARSWAEQGREDLHELREPKLLRGEAGMRQSCKLRWKNCVKSAWSCRLCILTRWRQSSR